MKIRTCVSKQGRFITGVHSPGFKVANMRENDSLSVLGKDFEGREIQNSANFPRGDVHAPNADRIYEIHNPLGFRGATFINSAWAGPAAENPQSISLPAPESHSFLDALTRWLGGEHPDGKPVETLLEQLPVPMQVALAGSSQDPGELTYLSRMCCELLFESDSSGPSGMVMRPDKDGAFKPVIRNHDIFEALVNNPALPEAYKQAMVLRPGIQGTSEIVGEYACSKGRSHVFEYLRQNSYIPWGHYAANMADDAVRYSIRDLLPKDMTGMRHLYYQRTFIRLAGQLGIDVQASRRALTPGELEACRLEILEKLASVEPGALEFNGVLWGWNFGFQLAHTGYRLHASHQQVHQQNAMIPAQVESLSGHETMPAFACGDMVDEFVRQYRRETGRPFFENYIAAVRNNTRTDGDLEKPSSLVIHEDDHTMLFVPKAQVSQWELQLMPKTSCGNILEADPAMRQSLDNSILKALQALESLGARMVTSIEFSRRFDNRNRDQYLLYSFIPRLPQAPPTFSEAQFRWISGCYPEDVALACRLALKGIPDDTS